MRTKPIKTHIHGKDVYVVYIEYQNSLPCCVITCHDLTYKGLDTWDFELNESWGEFMHFHSGMGGNIKKMVVPQFVEEYKGGSLWFCDMVKFGKYKPENCKILKNPIRLKKDNRSMIDPFQFSYQEVGKIIYCKFCNGMYNEDGCNEHMNLYDDCYNDGTAID